MQRSEQKYIAGEHFDVVDRTNQLYVIPCIHTDAGERWSRETKTWPRFHDGKYVDDCYVGESMLALSRDEYQALQIVVLRCDVKEEHWKGPPHHKNMKQVGLSRAYFKATLVTEESMPTARAVAALRYLTEQNTYYKSCLELQKTRIEEKVSLNIRSYDLLANLDFKGIECAMFPHLYPHSEWSDTARLDAYAERTADTTQRVCSIGLSWTRKVLSSVRVYGEQRDLSFFFI